MLFAYRNLTLAMQMFLGVGLVIVLVQTGITAFDVFAERAAVNEKAEKRGVAALNMLEAVHTQAMINRKEVGEDDPAIETLDGTMGQFSETGDALNIWLVMGPKVIDFQRSQGETEFESPRDEVDARVESTLMPYTAVLGDKLRISRPVVLGQGNAAHQRCVECHARLMNVQQGEIIGVYSAEVDMGPEFAELQTQLWTRVGLGVGAVVATLALLALLLRSTTIRPLRKLAQATTQLASGDAKVELNHQERRDEIGQMANALEVFRTNMVQKRELEQSAEDRHRQEQVRERERRAEEQKTASEQSFAVGALAKGLSRLAEGDLTVHLDERFATNFESLRNDFNNSVAALSDVLSSIRQSTETIGSGGNHMASSAKDLATRTESQAVSLEEVNASLTEVTTIVSVAGERVEDARNVAAEANESAKLSGSVVHNAEEAMRRIEESSGQISNIIGVIDEIAFQTNLLALNAGVEAARAGEAGKGFAVVAQEVRELAQRTGTAANEIKGLIEKSTLEVENGVMHVKGTSEALIKIGTYIETINGHMDAVSSLTREQAGGLGSISGAVNELDDVTQHNALMAEQSSASAAKLASETATLAELIENFRLRGSETEVPTATTMTKVA